MLLIEYKFSKNYYLWDISGKSYPCKLFVAISTIGNDPSEIISRHSCLSAVVTSFKKAFL
jgi:hypothetical protein